MKVVCIYLHIYLGYWGAGTVVISECGHRSTTRTKPVNFQHCVCLLMKLYNEKCYISKKKFLLILVIHKCIAYADHKFSALTVLTFIVVFYKVKNIFCLVIQNKKNTDLVWFCPVPAAGEVD